MGEGVAIRDAKAADAPALARLIGMLIAQYGLAVPKDLAQALVRDGFGERSFFRAFLAEKSGEALGAVLFYPVYHPSRAAPGLFMEDLVVSPDARGLGIGRKLLARLAAYAIAEGYTGIEWTVSETNANALAFYGRLGAGRLAGKTHWEIGEAELARFAKHTAGD